MTPVKRRRGGGEAASAPALHAGSSAELPERRVILSPVRRATIFALAVSAAALSALSAAAASPEKVAVDAAGESAARAVVLQPSDLAGHVSWSGGPARPVIPMPSPCPTDTGFHPSQSGLVLTGIAESNFTSADGALESEAQVMQTPAMATAAWKAWATPALSKCLAESIASGGTDETAVGLAPLSLPTLGSFSFGYQGLVEGGGARFVADWIYVSAGRVSFNLTSEILLASSVKSQAAILSAEKAELTTEVALARRIAARSLAHAG